MCLSDCDLYRLVRLEEEVLGLVALAGRLPEEPPFVCRILNLLQRCYLLVDVVLHNNIMVHPCSESDELRQCQPHVQINCVKVCPHSLLSRRASLLQN